MEEDSKKVDESWKERVEKEKKAAQESKGAYHEPNFTIFVSSLAMQAMIALGKLENPITHKTEKNPEQGRFLIDTLGVLKEKTKGNLAPEEEKLLADALYNLRMLYLQDNK
ncbi:protein containing DUF1844 [sediment metagenome]|uniref:Protein containing DUF1844 n=1 Tax=sediment metagenome TaxID=749907 RepID=D9PIK5_9ZZZZ